MSPWIINLLLDKPQLAPDQSGNVTPKAVATTGGMAGNNTGDARPCLYDVGKDVVGLF